MHERTDEHLMQRVRRDDDRASFRALYRRWRRRVSRFVARRVGAQSRPDALQEVWLSVWRYRRTFDERRAFAPWLFTLAARVRLPRASRPVAVELVRDDRPASALERLEYGELLEHSLAGLPELERTLVVLNAGGFPPRELATLTALTPNAVRTRLSRARRRVRSGLQAA